MRMKCIVSYDGTGFSGYQVQPGKRTVQSELEKALAVLHKGKEIKVAASGRTDAGVHARGQVIHFDTSLSIPSDRWPRALNSLLPDDVVLLSAEQAADDFHARYHAVKKEYRYVISREMLPDVFTRNFAYHYPYHLDVEAIRLAGEKLLGTHDFTSFCSARTESEDRIRTIFSFEAVEDGSLLTFRFAGSGFLYNMVRILTGTLLEIGSGAKRPDEIPAIIEAKNRGLAGKTAPAQGLYLWSVEYDN
ncbi:tRNA pseudouridine(38-40) synthase TruA [Metabacillus sp. GX 13764]|uniref:tRNA pseudouridine(38-40) synthase TruA n=1 Tax=Metabacillus kandeliae TaxID=2900151 RepID=UPI001E3DB235|nr:tRNA pseudouridine(38-40) synthase TruA [Metabacillus kandeliae]MCD7036611.1 tRNA pseudouridine(38-40) synthase TruA [Metabacillus kandeliae]